MRCNFDNGPGPRLIGKVKHLSVSDEPLRFDAAAAGAAAKVTLVGAGPEHPELALGQQFAGADVEPGQLATIPMGWGWPTGCTGR